MQPSSFRNIVSVLAFAVCAYSQDYRSTITGRVIDAQEAVVPGTKIVVKNVDTGVKSETVSTADGQYSLPYLPPGQYTMTAEASGFKRFLREGISVSANQRIGVDIKLEVGSQVETVTVTSEAPPLETATASTGQVINSRQIANMPLNGGTPLVLAQLAFGVIPTSIPNFVRPFDNSGPSSFSMGGAPATTNEILLDGMPNTTGNVGTVAYNPPVDAVVELKVEGFQADAAYGHTGGGTVNIILKSGTNSVHGSAYEFLQHPKLQATPFFTNLAGTAKNPTRFNQWGATAGGPVWIPKVFDGRNRLFFFFAYEGIHDGLPRPSTVTIPTAAERNGDFSQQLAAGASYQIYDPATGVKQGSRISRQPFPGNIIPKSRLNSVALNVLQLYPAANTAGRPDGLNNFTSSQVERNTYDNELSRVDWAVSNRSKLFVTYRHNDREDHTGLFDNNITTGNLFHRRNFGASADHVYTFTPTLLLDTRLNWSRFVTGHVAYGDGYDITKLGLPASLAAVAPRAKFPEFDFNSFQNIGTDTVDDAPFDIYQIFTTLNKVQGRHSLKFGGDFRMHRQSSYSYGNSTGLYKFGTSWTNGPLDNSTSAPLGQDLAGFLLGLPTGGGFDVNSFSTIQAGYAALFVQDDFRVRPNLFLNLGLRYERDLPTQERWNRAVNGFDSTTLNPVSAAASAAYDKNPIPQIAAGSFKVPGGLLFAGNGRQNLYETAAHYLSPRFGFSWTPTALSGKLVVRGGGGVFFAPIGVSGLNQPGFSQNTPIVPTLDSYLTPSATLSNPFPSGIQQPTGSSLGLSTFAGQSVTFYNTRAQNPYSVRWTLDIQRQLPWNGVFEFGYVGNHSVHLPVDTPLDSVPGKYYSNSLTRDQNTINAMTANVANPLAGLLPGTSLNGSTVQVNQLLMPFPQFSGVTETALNIGSSYLHMVQARYEKRFSNGLQLLSNFQFSKLIEKRTRLNSFDYVQLEKRISSDDRPRRFVLSLSYELPFGRGKAVAGSTGRVLDRVLGGWMLNSSYVRQVGSPISFGNVIYYGGDVQVDARNIYHAIDTTRFNTKSAEQLSWNVRTFPSLFSTLRGDGPNNVDLSIIKNTRIKEQVKLQIRLESFNVMNHPLFGNPNVSPTSSAFGTITSQSNQPRTVQLGMKMIW